MLSYVVKSRSCLGPTRRETVNLMLESFIGFLNLRIALDWFVAKFAEEGDG